MAKKFQNLYLRFQLHKTTCPSVDHDGTSKQNMKRGTVCCTLSRGLVWRAHSGSGSPKGPFIV